MCETTSLSPHFFAIHEDTSLHKNTFRGNHKRYISPAPKIIAGETARALPSRCYGLKRRPCRQAGVGRYWSLAASRATEFPPLELVGWKSVGHDRPPAARLAIGWRELAIRAGRGWCAGLQLGAAAPAGLRCRCCSCCCLGPLRPCLCVGTASRTRGARYHGECFPASAGQNCTPRLRPGLAAGWNRPRRRSLPPGPRERTAGRRSRLPCLPCARAGEVGSRGVAEEPIGALLPPRILCAGPSFLPRWSTAGVRGLLESCRPLWVWEAQDRRADRLRVRVLMLPCALTGDPA